MLAAMRAISVLVVFLAVTLAFGQITTPKKGSADRTAMMNALRIPIQKDIGQKVQFKVDSLKMLGNWAFMKGAPIRPDGKEIDYSHTQYAEAVKAGAFGYGVFALFKKTRGKWNVVKYSLGASDVPYVTWWRDYGAPKAIFDITEGG